jgi:hypothetical protein
MGVQSPLRDQSRTRRQQVFDGSEKSFDLILGVTLPPSKLQPPPPEIFVPLPKLSWQGGATARPKPGGAAPASSRDAPTGLRNLAGRVHGAGRHGGGEQGRGRGRGRDSAGHGVPAGRRGSAAGANSAATVEVHGNVRPRADAQDESKGNQKSRTLQEPAAKKKKIVEMCYLLGRTFHEHLPSTSWS